MEYLHFGRFLKTAFVEYLYLISKYKNSWHSGIYETMKNFFSSFAGVVDLLTNGYDHPPSCIHKLG